MSKPANKVAAYQDLLDLPENIVGQILGGDLITHPRPTPKHARAAALVGAILINKFDIKATDDDNGWWILGEPECHLGEDIVVPDIAGWRKTTLPQLPDSAWLDIRPDWVCEVLSPSTAKHDRGIKREIYAREEVGYYWIVDPIEKMVEVFALEKGNWVLVSVASDEQIVNLVPFEVMPFDLSALWV